MTQGVGKTVVCRKRSIQAPLRGLTITLEAAWASEELSLRIVAFMKERLSKNDLPPLCYEEGLASLGY